LIIQIDEQYRVTTDPYQWIVQKKRSRKNKEEWESQTYHPSFESALQSFGECLVRGSDAETLVDALADVEKAITILSQARTLQLEQVLTVSEEEIEQVCLGR